MDRPFQDVFKFCPVCGTESDQSGAVPFGCTQCEFTFYFPPTIAVGALIADRDGKVLFIERAKDPGKGKLGLPGGFVDGGETGEEAVIREIKEEVGLDTVSVEFLATFPNVYHYKGIINNVLDLFYVCQIETFDDLEIQKTEVNSYRFEVPAESIYEQMAFESNANAVRLFAEKHLSVS